MNLITCARCFAQQTNNVKPLIITKIMSLSLMRCYCESEIQYTHRQCLQNNASYEYSDFSIHFHQRSTAFTRSRFSSFYQRKLIMHVEYRHAIFGKPLKLSMVWYRKCNFMLIDVEVGLLLSFLASMKATIHLYQNMYLFLGVYK